MLDVYVDLCGTSAGVDTVASPGKTFPLFPQQKKLRYLAKTNFAIDFWVNIRVKKALCYIFQLKPCTVQKKRVSNPLICEQFTCLYETNIKNIFCYFCANLYREVRPPTFSKKKKYSSHFGQNRNFSAIYLANVRRKNYEEKRGKSASPLVPCFDFVALWGYTYDIACSWDMNAKVCTILVRTRLWKDSVRSPPFWNERSFLLSPSEKQPSYRMNSGKLYE